MTTSTELLVIYRCQDVPISRILTVASHYAKTPVSRWIESIGIIAKELEKRGMNGSNCEPLLQDIFNIEKGSS